MCAQPREPDASALIPKQPRVCPVCGGSYGPDVRFCPADGQVLHDQPVATDPLIGTMIADRYLVEKRLGMGGMGVVYLAQQVYMSRRCALKVLRPELLSDGDAIKRFVREAKNASRISHPNVAAIYDFGRMSTGQMYLAMEYVDGETLSSVLAREGTLPPAACASIIDQVAKGVQAAHDLGITHRDLKPDNVMLAATPSSASTVKVVDFGIARMAFEEAQQVTASVMVIGTPAYMSPEQITGGPVDGRSDTYSLALVTYAALTGRLPFNSSDLDLRLRFLQEPKTLADLNPGVAWPAELQAVLSRALSTDLEDRQPSIQDFGRDVARILGAWASAPASASAAEPSGLPGAGNAFRLSNATPGATAPSGPIYAVVSSRRPRSVGLVVAGAAMLVIGAATVRGLRGARTPHADAVRTRIDSAPVVAEPLRASADSPAAAAAPVETKPAPKDKSHEHSRETAPPAKPRHIEVKAAPPAAPVHVDSSPARPPATPPIVVSNPVQPAPVVPESVSKPVDLPPAIRIGTPYNQGAELLVNGTSRGVIRGPPRTIQIPQGLVELRLHLEGCEDWDTTLTARSGAAIPIGVRHPKCSP